MKNVIAYFIIAGLVCGCSNNKIPDVSGIKATVEVQRFERDFFSVDTNNIDKSLQQLHQKYPAFLQDFIFNILGLPPQPDSAKVLERQIKRFIKSYQPLKDSCDHFFTELSGMQQDITKGLQFVKYYFPMYPLPHKLVTFIGPIDGYGNILTTDALAIGLQLYMGSEFSGYKTESIQTHYPAYISRRFQKEYIAVNSIKTIIDDLWPDRTAGKPLIEQMVQTGKRLYLLDRFMPETADTLKTGYTKKQLDGCYTNESAIWSFFVQNDLIYSLDATVIRDYMIDAPKTQVFGENSPGFIGQFVGWQIVKKWMKKNENITLPVLIKTDPKTIFEEAKYKP